MVAVSINVVSIGEAIDVGSVFILIANIGNNAPMILDIDIDINKHKDIPADIVAILFQSNPSYFSTISKAK